MQVTGAVSLMVVLCLVSGIVPAEVADAGLTIVVPDDPEILVEEGEMLRNDGNLLAAQQKFDQALQIAGQNSKLPPVAKAAFEAASGYNLFLLNKTTMAVQQLTDAYLKTVAGPPYLHALIGEYLGFVSLSAGEKEQTVAYFAEALSNAKLTDNDALIASLELQRAGLSDDGSEARFINFRAIAAKVNELPNDFNKVLLQLELSRNLLELKSQTMAPDQIARLDAIVFDLLTNVLALTENGGHDRLRAESLAGLARLYSLKGKNEDALALLDRAIELLGHMDVKELHARLEAQKADLLSREGENERALTAYEHAVQDLFAIRAEMPVTLPDGRSAINVLTDPIHRSYVDLLLRMTEGGGRKNISQAVYEAVDNMEIIKDADIDDFFLGKCLFYSSKHVDWKTVHIPEAAIVYPILLEDRIELVVKTDQTILLRNVKIPLDEVKSQIHNLVNALRLGRPFRPAAQQLYNWLFKPIADQLDKHRIKTLIYVPDRELRSVPYAALYDGKHFVVEDFAVVTMPRLIFNNQSYQPRKTQSPRQLLAGLSFANGPSLEKLPKRIFAQYANLGKTGSLLDKETQLELAAENLSLPSVEKEIGMLAGHPNDKVLLNNQFTRSNFKESLESGDYDKVHIASHGFFGNNAKNSFILAYDEIFSLEDFQESLNSDQLKQKPIDLLILSACETAQGDDSMLLGFSGMAIRSNVRSALGSLWPIDDEGALEFMRLFYDGVNKAMGKAQALKEAQVAMLKSVKYKHPYYWSPYILMGDWQ